jgi:hypothetical protein
MVLYMLMMFGWFVGKTEVVVVENEGLVVGLKECLPASHSEGTSKECEWKKKVVGIKPIEAEAIILWKKYLRVLFIRTLLPSLTHHRARCKMTLTLVGSCRATTKQIASFESPCFLLGRDKRHCSGCRTVPWRQPTPSETSPVAMIPCPTSSIHPTRSLSSLNRSVRRSVWF